MQSRHRLLGLRASAPSLAPAALALAPAALALAAATVVSRPPLHARRTVSTAAAADLGEHRRRPDQCTCQHSRRSHCPCRRHLLPQRRAQHHQERHPRGGGGSHGCAERTGELLESAPCAEDQPGLVRRRATDPAQHHGRLHGDACPGIAWWRWCLRPVRQDYNGLLSSVFQHSFRMVSIWWWCLR